MQPIRAEITRRLTESLNPVKLEVIDESQLHAGHIGHNPEGESHFRVMVVSEKFSGKTRLECQRIVLSLLDDLLKTRIHALSLQLSPIKSPE